MQSRLFALVAVTAGLMAIGAATSAAWAQKSDTITPAGLGSLRSLGSTDTLFANSRGGQQSGQHVGGMLVGLGDGSVRSGGKQHSNGANFLLGDGSVRNGSDAADGGFIGTASPTQANGTNPPPPPPPPRPLPVLMVLPNMDYGQQGPKFSSDPAGASTLGQSSTGGSRAQSIGAIPSASIKGAKTR